MSFPISIDLEYMKIAVIGFGKVARRKTTSLIERGATVFVYSNKFENLDEYVHYLKNGKLKTIEKDMNFENLSGLDEFDIIVAATSDSYLNERIAQYCLERRKLVNCASDRKYSNFIFCSNIYRGKLSIGVSTDGASPALAGNIKKSIEKILDDGDIERRIDILAKLREYAVNNIVSQAERRKYLREISTYRIGELEAELEEKYGCDTSV